MKEESSNANEDKQDGNADLKHGGFPIRIYFQEKRFPFINEIVRKRMFIIYHRKFQKSQFNPRRPLQSLTNQQNAVHIENICFAENMSCCLNDQNCF